MADIFHFLETNRKKLDIESFSLSQTTLEQVFMIMAENKNPEQTKTKIWERENLLFAFGKNKKIFLNLLLINMNKPFVFLV